MYSSLKLKDAVAVEDKDDLLEWIGRDPDDLLRTLDDHVLVRPRAVPMGLVVVE